MKRPFRPILSGALVLLMGLAVGCGLNSGQPSALSSQPHLSRTPDAGRRTPFSTGTLQLTVFWPELPAFQAKVIPTSTTNLRFTITAADISPDYVQTVARQGSGAQTVTLNDIPTGNDRTLLVEALNSSSQVTANKTTTGLSIATGTQSLSVTLDALNPPTISSLSPNNGSWTQSVTIAGTNFGSSPGGSTVKFNGIGASTSSWSSTSITATVPDGSNTGNVVVRVDGVDSNGVNFTVNASIGGLNPSIGPISSAVTISGTNFGASQGSSTVYFGSTTASVSNWSNTSITATVPSSLTPGSYPVRVRVNNIDSNPKQYSVRPDISSLSPTCGATGTGVTISGNNFGSSQGSSTVKFNGVTATPQSWSNTQIMVPVPSGATTGPVVVRVNSVDSNGVTFNFSSSCPTISSLSPTSGSMSTNVTINGSNFGSTQGNSTVKFNGVTATQITQWFPTQVKAYVPSGATTGNVVVRVNGLDSNGVTFTVICTCPLISGLSPTSGPANTEVTIYGGNFGSTQGSSTVKFNGTQATQITQWTDTQVKARVPSGATTGLVVVRVNNIDSNGVTFTVQ